MEPIVTINRYVPKRDWYDYLLLVAIFITTGLAVWLLVRTRNTP